METRILDPHRRAGAAPPPVLANEAVDPAGALAKGARRPGDRGHAEQSLVRHRRAWNHGAPRPGARMNETAYLREMTSDLQFAPAGKVIYLEGKTDIPI